MQPTDLDRIERELQVHLPRIYRDTLEAYPLPPDDDSARLWLHDDADEIIASTRSWRDSRPSGSVWPSTYVYVGCDGGEYVHFLDTGNERAPILVYDLETGGWRREEELDLVSFIAKCRRDLDDIEADERAITERFRRKKWWQFWIRPYPARDAT